MAKFQCIEHPEVKDALDSYRDMLEAIENDEYPLLEVNEAPDESAEVLAAIEDNRYPLLFRTDLNLSDQLDRNELPKGFRQQFRDAGIDLSDDITVSVEAINSRWWITDEDNEQIYVIKRSAGELDIFWLPSRDDFRELAYQLTLACRSSLNKTWNPVDMEFLEK